MKGFSAKNAIKENENSENNEIENSPDVKKNLSDELDKLNNLLKETNLKIDKQGRTRNSKSFRSTHIMYRLLAKKTIKSVAVNCGTSSGTIDNFYAKFITIDMYDDSFTDLPE